MKEHAKSTNATQTHSRKNRAVRVPGISCRHAALASIGHCRRLRAGLTSVARVVLVNVGFVLLAALLFLQPGLTAFSSAVEARSAAPADVGGQEMDSVPSAAQAWDLNTETLGDAEILDQAANAQVPFIENQGQIDNPAVRFYAQTFAGTVYVEDGGVLTYDLPAKSGQGWVMKETVCERTNLTPAGVDPSATTVSSFVGDNSQTWQTGLPTYNSISFGEVQDGISLSLKAYGNNVEKIFVVQPGGEPQAIWVQVDGARGLLVAEDGRLEVDTELGTIGFTKPTAYQQQDGTTLQVDVTYVAFDNQTYGYEVGSYDRSLPLVIDPLLASTFVGGSGGEEARALCLDAAGNVYVTGYTASSDYPLTVGAYDATFDSGSSNVPEAYVTKLNSDLTAVVASTFLGGSSGEIALDLCLDAAGNVYVIGDSGSTDFPTTPGAYQGAPGGTNNLGDCFVSKLSGDLTSLLASTLIGGSDSESGVGLCLDEAGNVYITGSTVSSDYPTTAGAYDGSFNNGVYQDVFVSRLNGELTSLEASTLLGGSAGEHAGTIRLDPSSDELYVAGSTESVDYPTTPGSYDQTCGGASDGFITRLSGDLTTVSASTFIGGTDGEGLRDLRLDSSGNVYVAIETGSSDYPTTAGAYDQTLNGSEDIAVSRLDHDLTSLSASTLVGGSGTEQSWTLCLDAAGNVYVAGTTGSSDYPTTPGAYDGTFNDVNGNGDGFVSSLNSDLTELTASTFIGGSDVDGIVDICADSSDSLYFVAMTTLSPNYPTTPGAYDRTFNNGDVAVSKLDCSLSADPDLVMADISWLPADIIAGDQVTFTFTVRNNGGTISSAFDVDFKVDGVSGDVLNGVQEVSGLEAGASVTLSSSWTATPGTYTAGACADVNGAISESDESNNVLSAEFDVISADLIVSALTWSPAEVSLGEYVGLTATVVNSGSTAISGPFEVQFGFDGTVASQQVDGGLAAGASVEVDAPAQWYMSRAGLCAAKAIVDPENAVPELDDTNNELVVQVDVGAADLVISGLDYSPADPSLGDQVTVTAVVQNAGNRPTQGSFTVAFSFDGSMLGTSQIDAIIAPGGSVQVTSSPYQVSRGGIYDARAWADYDKAVLEQDESNNEVSVQVNVTDSDLVITALTWAPSEVSLGDYVGLTATVVNAGTRAVSGSFQVKLWYDVFAVSQQVDGGLAVGASVQVTVPSHWYAWRTGPRVARARADSGQVVAELDETNNELSVQVDVGAPDLVVSGISYYAISLGDYWVPTATVQNVGNRTARGPFTVGFTFGFLGWSAGGVVQADLAPGESVQITPSKVLRVWVEGSYPLTARADSQGAIPELDETNNAVTVQVQVGAPDLVIGDIFWDPPESSPGGQVTFSAVVCNVGTRQTRGDFDVLFTVDNGIVGLCRVGALGPGSSVIVSATWTARSGTHTVRAIADVNFAVLESNGFNNRMTRAIYIPTTNPPGNQPPSKPTNSFPGNGSTISLDIQSLTLKSSSFLDPDAGDTFGLAEWQIRETGGSWSSPVYDKWLSSSVYVNGRTVPYCAFSSEVFKKGTSYFWRVRHMDNRWSWSAWSDETKFTIAPDAVLLVHGIKLETGWNLDEWIAMVNRFLPAQNQMPNNNGADLDVHDSPVGPFGSDRYRVYVSNYTHDAGGTGNPTILEPIQHYAHELAREVHAIREATGDGKITIIAHSMGGMVARAYVESGDFSGNSLYANDVGDLIMLGTPNHGWNATAIGGGVINQAFWSFLGVSGLIAYNMLEAPAVVQVTTGSAFEKMINHGTTLIVNPFDSDDKINPSVAYHTVAGITMSGPIIGSRDWILGIPRDSVYLDGADNRVVDGVGHSGLIQDDAAWNKFCDILGLCAASAASAQGELSVSTLMASTDTAGGVATTPAVSGTIYPGQTVSSPLLVSHTTRATIAVYWPGSELDLTLTTPSGAVIDPAAADTDPNVVHLQESDATFMGGYVEAYTLDAVEQGIWTVNVTAVDVAAEGEPYLVFALLETDLELSIGLDQYGYSPGAPMHITADLTLGGQGTGGATVVAGIQTLGGVSEDLVLYDDGLHGDEDPNDGKYANDYLNTGTLGMYLVKVTATGSVNDQPFERQDSRIVWVEDLPDLGLEASDISFSETDPTEGSSITVSAAIHNLGQVDTENVSILFYDGKPELGDVIGEALVTIPAGGVTQASVSWTAEAGDHDIYVLVSPYNAFIDADYSNNAAQSAIHVGGDTILASAGGPYVADEGTAVFLDASGSTHPDGAPLQYRWDFDGDGAWDTDWSDIPEAAFTWPDDWTGNVTVEVSDGSTSSRASAPVTVTNVAPMVELSVEQLVPGGSQVRFTDTYFEDPGTGDSHTVLWDFGDGQTSVDTQLSAHSYAAAGQYTVTLTVTDDDGGVGTDTVTITVGEVNNGILAAADTYYVSEGSSLDIGASGVLSNDAGSALTAILVTSAVSGTLTLNADGSFVYVPNAGFDGTDSFSYKANDGTADSNTATVTIIVVPVITEPPIVEAGADQTVNEGDAVTFAGSYTSSDGGTPTILWDFGDGSTASDDLAPTHAYGDNGVYLVTLTVTDEHGGMGTDSLTVTVGNVAPAVGDVAAPVDPVAVNTTINVTAPVADPGILDTHTALWDWGDGSTSAGTITESGGSGTVAGTHTYTAAGVYSITLAVTDDDTASGESVFRYVVVYDPSAGFVTGGGWINSPAGAYVGDPSLTGKATFGFVAKYQKGAQVPTGQTQFRFSVAGLNFQSTDYQWLVVAGAKAMYKGSGTINGSGDYGFILSAIDGQISGGGGVDKFRIKIWDKTTGEIVYDNQMGAAEDADATTALGGGSIVIHKN